MADAATFQMELHELMWAIAPRGLLAPPVGGDLADEAASVADAGRPLHP